jgi:hypothetical protein
MQFQNDKRKPVEIDVHNFEGILQGRQFGLTPVKLKNGRVEWIKQRKTKSYKLPPKSEEVCDSLLVTLENLKENLRAPNVRPG